MSEESTSKTSPSATSHLVYVSTLPSDAVKIDKYLEHEFQSLYYSPSTKLYYQAPKQKFRQITPGKSSISCRSNADKTVRISLKKLRKLMGTE